MTNIESKVFHTEHGVVTVSGPYFSPVRLSTVFNYTLTKHENNEFGWGVSKEFLTNATSLDRVTQSKAEEFATAAKELL